uniref:ATP synthase complex subunit 8 n=1 Tax=Pachygrapsus marmoratus TaxID=135190 RepID=A0A343S8N6_PACMR|nr:ATP synthase F0 subunit 8 [Pachygrapsus marmoratus]AUN45011.1 ATP synthase F0 subunit 8 [Pachygrapsus marmoratus]
MPQMAPIYWLYMFFFFLLSFSLFFTLNYFIKPFDKIEVTSDSYYLHYKPWKL